MVFIFFLSLRFSPKFFVFSDFDNGISSQLVFGIPIIVSTWLFSNIFDFNSFDETKRLISFSFFSFDNKKATHLVPFPHASAAEPSEL